MSGPGAHGGDPDAWAMSPQDERRVLERRAQALARRPTADAEGPALELIVLGVGDERYGVQTRSVERIMAADELGALAGVPAHWAGIVNVRGTVRAVLDLAQRIGGSRAGASRPETAGAIALVQAAGLTVGLLADTADAVLTAPRSALLARVDHRGIPTMGIVPGPDGLVAIIDVEALLADPELVVDHTPSRRAAHP